MKAILKDGFGRSDVLGLSNYVTHHALTAATVKVIALPAAGEKAALITAPVDLYIKSGANPAVPSGDVTDGTGATFIPAGATRAIWLDSLTDLRVIAAVACVVTVEWTA